MLIEKQKRKVCKFRQGEKMGCCQQCRNPELFPARVKKVLGCMAPCDHQVDSVEGFVVLTFTVLVFGLGVICHRRQAVHLHCEVVSFSAIERITDCEVERVWLCWASE